jgi:hypothetical protein
MLGALAVGGPAAAHHSSAMFDRSKEVAITGTVKEFQYTNPHSWLMVVTQGPDGQEVQWGFESEGPSTLLRNGIKHSTFQPGDKVTAHGNPMRDGRPAGSLISVTKENGQTVWFRGGPQPQAAQGAAPAS